MEPVKSSRYRLGGVIGARLRANEFNWLTKAPGENPGMLGMFANRDISSPSDLVPWAGEFIGKYLLSAIQALRFTDNADLHSQTANLVAAAIACQADDGYLGPFPRSTRLTANWDLWGHYHVLQALLLWHDETDDVSALAAAERIGELICNTFLDSDVRVRDTGSSEMNMAVIHGLGLLYLRTHNPRLLAMVRQIEIDWETSGDYLRTGIEGIPFYATRHPRWESLHDLQGLAALYRISGDRRYLQAFECHWRSILRWDVHNTGAFSTSEGAIGDPYTPGAIETCCTIAWIALTIDYLDLTGDPRAADALEIALYNAAAGAQHPDGEWFTYDTPMEGVRVPSFSALAFQARADTPGLNCCSVNGPRSLTMLSDWAVTRAGQGLAVNYYGPGTYDGVLSDSTRVNLEWITEYPLDGCVRLIVNPERPVRFPLLLRIPAWSRKTQVNIEGGGNTDSLNPVPGRYLTIDREWNAGDSVMMDFDFGLRISPGDGAALGKVSVYRGPVLLAYDTALNVRSPDPAPAIVPKHLSNARVLAFREAQDDPESQWLNVAVPAVVGGDITLRDFAGAGQNGTFYSTWMPCPSGPLPTPTLRLPDDGAMLRRADIVLSWSAPPPNVHELAYQLLVSEHTDLSAPLINRRCLNGTSYRITGSELNRIRPSVFYFWCVSIEGRRGSYQEVKFPARFKIAP